ncbi:MAG: asnB [Bacteroidetes bacterium]|nr:asnB [Bacteroidota bacterium]
MCGIAGIINLKESKVEESALQKMGSFLNYRGPDHYGMWCEKNIGLVHRRLSIIDLSDKGNQPMLDAEKNIVITFNGEIYNFLDIRKQLQKEGVTFNTDSDTEVIIYAYKIWGIEKMLQQIDGMFAFAICDLLKQKVYLCRDRFGKKPLYYSFYNNNCYFSSDIRSIVPFIDNPQLDYDSVDYYFSEMSVPQPKTIWKNIQQVYKSAFICIDVVTGTHTENEYWKLESAAKLSLSFNEAEKEVEQTLIDAILKRTIADVPIGCFLSGGVDSGLIVSLLAQNTSARVKTFSIGFAEEEFNELPYAKKLAERYNTEHTEIIVKPDIENEITDLVEFFGEPFADSSAIPSFYVCREMGKFLKVALSGDGGDELFGYSNYLFMQKADEFAKKYTSQSQRDVMSVISKVKSRINPGSENYGAINSFYKEKDSGSGLLRGMSFVPEEKKQLYKNAELLKHAAFAEKEMKKIWTKHASGSLADTLFLASLDTRLLNDYLVKVDRSSMRSSLEVRSPFLDKSLAELAFRLPNEYKLKGNDAKYILKTLAQKHIDKDILTRKKQGFAIPVKHWLNNELKGLVETHLSKEQVEKRGFFNPDYVVRIIREHKQNAADHTHKIWSLLWFELWCGKFM